MQTLQITIDESVYDKLITFIETLPKDRVSMEKVSDEPGFPTITFKEAQTRVRKSMDDIKNGTATLYSDEEVFELLDRS